jgi:hypothetical protein
MSHELRESISTGESSCLPSEAILAGVRGRVTGVGNRVAWSGWVAGVTETFQRGGVEMFLPGFQGFRARDTDVSWSVRSGSVPTS